MRKIVGSPDAGDFGRDIEHRRRKLAGHQIGFVALGHSEDHVGVAGTGSFQCCWMSGIADDSAQIETILQFAQPCGVLIDHCNIVGFGNQVLGHGTADLASAQYDYAQAESPLRTTVA